MSDCDKLKKKAIIGGALCMYLLFIRIVDVSEYLGTGLALLSIVLIPVIGLFLAMPYFRCLNDFNNSHKPPHERLQ